MKLVSCNLPDISYEANSHISDYAASALNEQSCYTGEQYIEANVDFKKLYSKINKIIAPSILTWSKQISQIDLITRNFRTSLYAISKIEAKFQRDRIIAQNAMYKLHETIRLFNKKPIYPYPSLTSNFQKYLE